MIRPKEDDCPHCERAGTLQCRLEAGLTASNGRRLPTLEHVTDCTECGAERRVTVRLDKLNEGDALERPTAWQDLGDTKSRATLDGC